MGTVQDLYHSTALIEAVKILESSNVKGHGKAYTVPETSAKVHPSIVRRISAM